jgi:peptidoglycan lytic transglycosylase
MAGTARLTPTKLPLRLPSDRSIMPRGLFLGVFLWATSAQAEGFLDKWYGRIAPAPAHGIASIYWEDFLDARGKRFKPNEVSCAMRTERLNTVVIVINKNNGRRIECPVQDRGPYAQSRVIDLSRGAAKALGCSEKEGLCPVEIYRKGYE